MILYKVPVADLYRPLDICFYPPPKLPPPQFPLIWDPVYWMF